MVSKSAMTLCFSSICRSIVGVAGGATRMQITTHQAKNGSNLADVNAKDGAQETFVNLVALLVNIYFIPILVKSRLIMWSVFYLLVILHIFFNYKAVTTVKSNLINIYRLEALLKSCNYNVAEINHKEPIINSIFFDSKLKIGSYLSHGEKITHRTNEYLYTETGNLIFKQGLTQQRQIEIIILSQVGFKEEKFCEIYSKIKSAGWRVDKHLIHTGDVKFN